MEASRCLEVKAMKSTVIGAFFGIVGLMLAVACASSQVPPTITPTQPILALPTVTPTQPALHVTPDSQVVANGLLQGDPCKPPCWQSLIPGKSTRQEVAKVVEQLRARGLVDHVLGGDIGGYYIQPSLLSPDSSILISMKSDIVETIDGAIDFDYSVGTLIDLLGKPEGIYPAGGGNFAAGHSCDEWQPPQEATMNTPVHILYPQQGLYFLMLEPMNNMGFICPEMKVTSYCFFVPLSMPEALNNNYLANLCGVEGLKGVTEQDILKWRGFGSGY